MGLSLKGTLFYAGKGSIFVQYSNFQPILELTIQVIFRNIAKRSFLSRFAETDDAPKEYLEFKRSSGMSEDDDIFQNLPKRQRNLAFNGLWRTNNFLAKNIDA